MSLAILCPGQGDQSPAMFAAFTEFPEAQALFGLCADRLGTDPRAMGSAELQRNRIAQPSICAVQLAAWRILRDRLPTISLFAGYSLGELSAYGCADALSADALLDLALSRATLMDRMPHGGLMAVRGLTLKQLGPLADALGLEVAIINGDDRLVLGGAPDALDQIDIRLTEAGAKTTRLAVEIASHTRLMAGAASDFSAVLAASPLADPSPPVLAGIDGSAISKRDRAIPALARQLCQRLDWASCMDALIERGCRAALELGPGDALSRMLRDRHPRFPARALQDFHSFDGAAQWAGRAVEDFHGGGGGV
jgi:[acyl-carrier-protein] S-malonyltransferase